MSILIFIHSSFALLTIVAIVTALIASQLGVQRERLVLGSLWASLVGAFTSGIILTLFTPATLGRSCLLLTSFALLTLGAHIIYRRSLRHVSA